jgi:hypothetical protein
MVAVASPAHAEKELLVPLSFIVNGQEQGRSSPSSGATTS